MNKKNARSDVSFVLLSGSSFFRGLPSWDFKLLGKHIPITLRVGNGKGFCLPFLIISCLVLEGHVTYSLVLICHVVFSLGSSVVFLLVFRSNTSNSFINVLKYPSTRSLY